MRKSIPKIQDHKQLKHSNQDSQYYNNKGHRNNNSSSNHSNNCKRLNKIGLMNSLIMQVLSRAITRKMKL